MKKNLLLASLLVAVAPVMAQEVLPANETVKEITPTETATPVQVAPISGGEAIQTKKFVPITEAIDKAKIKEEARKNALQKQKNVNKQAVETKRAEIKDKIDSAKEQYENEQQINAIKREEIKQQNEAKKQELKNTIQSQREGVNKQKEVKKQKVNNTIQSQREGVQNILRQREEDIETIKKNTAEDFTNLKKTSSPVNGAQLDDKVDLVIPASN